MIENPFDAPIPGQSLTDTPSNAKWEHPPQFTDVEEASEHIWERLHDRNFLPQVLSFLKEGIPVEAIARMVLFSGFMKGKWTPDVAILLSEIVFKQIMAIGVAAKIPDIKMFLKDQSNSKFYSEFAEFKLDRNKAKASEETENKAEKFAKKIKAELEENESSGLMKKETE